jgi:anti-sigma factor RsiW
MAAETNRNDDILRLNALVDGELSAAEQAALAARLATDRDLARAHATLANLKATVVASAEACPVPTLPVAPRRWLPAVGLGAVAAAVAAMIVVAVAVKSVPEQDSTAEVPLTIVNLAALPASPVVPDLAASGLKLAGIAMESPGGTATVVATYLGPRGCRLVLRVQRADIAVPSVGGTSRSMWTVDDLAYELTAYGMPSERFAAVAAAAKHATRNGGIPGDSRRLRQASRAATPSVG